MIFFYLLAIFGTTSSSSIFFKDRVYNTSVGWSLVRYIHRSPPLIIQLANRNLMHILDSERSIQLVSLDFKTCNVPLNLTYPMRYPRHAVSLGNGKIIIWLLSYSYVKSYHEGEWRFVIVDPTKCRHHGFEMPDREPDLIDIVDVVGYEDSFDVFFMRLSQEEPRKIYVFRYGHDGRPLANFINNVYQGDLLFLF